MPYQISLLPDDVRFAADADQSVLESALAAGLLIPHGCRNGACGACKGRVITGRIDHRNTAESVLPATERESGYALLCCAVPCSDLVLEVSSVRRAGDVPVKKLPCRVQLLERVAPDVMKIELKLPAGEPFQFYAGQYIDILLADGQRRSFSIANAPDEQGSIELHVRLIDKGVFTGHVFNGMKVRDILRFEGPLGTFRLSDAPLPVIMVAGGTGFAPIKAMIEEMIRRDVQRSVTLYWGARTQSGLYMDKLARHWETQLTGFRYIPVLSENIPEDGWSGRRGLVHEAVLADMADLSDHEVYVCGAPAMIDAARRAFRAERNLPEKAFFADAFTFSSSPS